jgi:hypothetical protein
MVSGAPASKETSGNAHVSIARCRGKSYNNQRRGLRMIHVAVCGSCLLFALKDQSNTSYPTHQIEIAQLMSRILLLKFAGRFAPALERLQSM